MSFLWPPRGRLLPPELRVEVKTGAQLRLRLASRQASPAFDVDAVESELTAQLRLRIASTALTRSIPSLPCQTVERFLVNSMPPSSLDLSTLIQPNIIVGALATITANIDAAKEYYIDALSLLELVDGTEAAKVVLQAASEEFTDIYGKTQTNASAASAGMDSFHSAVAASLGNIAQSTATLEEYQKIFAQNISIPIDFTACNAKLLKAKGIIVPIAQRIARERQAELDAAVKKLSDAQDEVEKVKGKLKESLKGPVALLGLGSGSPSMQLYGDMSPGAFLDGMLDTLKDGADIASDAGEGPEKAIVTAGKDAINFLATLQDVLDLKTDLIKAQSAVTDAAIELSALKRAQANIDPAARLQNAVIDIAQIETSFTTLSSQLIQLGSIYPIMTSELTNALALIDLKSYNMARRGLNCADAVLSALQPALETFATKPYMAPLTSAPDVPVTVIEDAQKGLQAIQTIQTTLTITFGFLNALDAQGIGGLNEDPTIASTWNGYRMQFSQWTADGVAAGLLLKSLLTGMGDAGTRATLLEKVIETNTIATGLGDLVRRYIDFATNVSAAKDTFERTVSDGMDALSLGQEVSGIMMEVLTGKNADLQVANYQRQVLQNQVDRLKPTLEGLKDALAVPATILETVKDAGTEMSDHLAAASEADKDGMDDICENELGLAVNSSAVLIAVLRVFDTRGTADGSY
ncbi:hypothetical protein MKEN_01301500 [Mycena kentingensis (nom. inval.)]|nr:hypothetical protein MKEN_01301500 [Mycena kentingensis (nom. inval.)]